VIIHAHAPILCAYPNIGSLTQLARTFSAAFFDDFRHVDQSFFINSVSIPSTEWIHFIFLLLYKYFLRHAISFDVLQAFRLLLIWLHRWSGHQRALIFLWDRSINASLRRQQSNVRVERVLLGDLRENQSIYLKLWSDHRILHHTFQLERNIIFRKLSNVQKFVRINYWMSHFILISPSCRKLPSFAINLCAQLFLLHFFWLQWNLGLNCGQDGNKEMNHHWVSIWTGKPSESFVILMEPRCDEVISVEKFLNLLSWSWQFSMLEA